MKDRTDLNLGDLYVSIIYRFPDSRLNLLNADVFDGVTV